MARGSRDLSRLRAMCGKMVARPWLVCVAAGCTACILLWTLLQLAWMPAAAALPAAQSLTVVTGFWDLGRGNWSEKFRRDEESYFRMGQRMLTLPYPLVFHGSPGLCARVLEERRALGFGDRTEVVELAMDRLPRAHLRPRIAEVMRGFARPDADVRPTDPDNPEYTNPDYDVVMFSKVPLVTQVAARNPFGSSHFAWLDFGVRSSVLLDRHLGRAVLTRVPDRMRFLKRRPLEPDPGRDIVLHMMSRTDAALAGTMFTGSAYHFAALERLADLVIDEALRRGAVDSDQIVFEVVYMRVPELFSLYHGTWENIVARYDCPVSWPSLQWVFCDTLDWAKNGLW
jgi:hypothetical protein